MLLHAQNADTVRDVFVLPTGASYINLTDSVYFALPRYRLERLARDAIAGDTLQSMLQRQAERYEHKLNKSNYSLHLWQGIAVSSLGIIIISLLIRS